VDPPPPGNAITPPDDIVRQAAARARLGAAAAAAYDRPAGAAIEADVVVTFNEISRQHGTGALVRNLFGGGESMVSVRVANLYRRGEAIAEEPDFGIANFCLGRLGLSRREIFERVLGWFQGIAPRRILSIPYSSDGLLLAIALREVFDVPLCLYIMDDRNIGTDGIPDSLMREAVAKSSIALAISPEMCAAYRRKFQRPFWLLPPLVDDSLIDSGEAGRPECSQPLSGAIVGNIWSQRWLVRLCAAVHPLDCRIDWFANVPDAGWLDYDPAQLAQDGIFVRQRLSEPDLARALRGYAFAIVPSGDLDEPDELRSVARFSLPAKIPFLFACAGLPMVVLGDPAGAAARFVERFGVGMGCPYEADRLGAAIDAVSAPERRREMRANALAIARSFSNRGAAEWLWSALDRGSPPDDRYERLLPAENEIPFVHRGPSGLADNVQ
jgi:hypothetical protein